MNRSFSTREKVLLLILAFLLLGCFYYLVVLQPSLNAIAQAQSKLGGVQDEIVVQQAIATKKTQLEAQIEQEKAEGITRKSLPAYDNTKNEITALDTILSEANNYSINFSDADTSNSLVRRKVSITFSTSSYAAAQSVLTKLINCQYTCLVGDITITGDELGQTGSTGTVNAAATVTFFEKKDA